MLRRWFVGLFLFSVLAFSLLPRTWAAAEPPAGRETATKEGPAEKEGGGLDIFQGSLDLAIWTIVVFLILLVILGRYAWGPMLEGLKKREQGIHEAIEKAQRELAEAQRLRGELEQRMAKSQEEINQMFDKARRDAQRSADEMMGQARATIQADRDRAHREIESAKDQALHQIWTQTAELAAMVSSKAIRRQLTPEDHRRLVDEALVGLNQAATGNGSGASRHS